MPAGVISATASASRSVSGHAIAAWTMARQHAAPEERDDGHRDAGDDRRAPDAGVADPPAQHAAEAGAEQQREQRHRQRVDRMAEQQHEALQQRDLDQHERAAEAGEVGERSKPAGAERSAGGHRERAEDEQHDQERRDRQQHQQRRQSARRPRARVDRPLDVHAEQPEHGRHERVVAQLRRVKEERPVVGRRRDVERVLRVERVAIRREQQARVVVAVVAERRRRRAGHVEHREARGWRRHRSSVCASSGVNGVFFSRNVATLSCWMMARRSAGSQPRRAPASCASEIRRSPSKTQREMLSTPRSVR